MFMINNKEVDEETFYNRLHFEVKLFCMDNFKEHINTVYDSITIEGVHIKVNDILKVIGYKTRNKVLDNYISFTYSCKKRVLRVYDSVKVNDNEFIIK